VRSSYWHLESISPEISTAAVGSIIPGGFPIGTAGDSGDQDEVKLLVELGTGPGGGEDDDPTNMLPVSWDGQMIDGKSIWAFRLPGSTTEGISGRGSVVEGETKLQSITNVNCETQTTADAIVSLSWPDTQNLADNNIDPMTGFSNACRYPFDQANCDLLLSTNKKTVVDQPIITDIQVVETGETSVKIYWNDTLYEDGFIILRDGLEIGRTGQDVTSFSDNNNLTCGTTYFYAVQAFSPLGKSTVEEQWAVSLSSCPSDSVITTPITKTLVDIKLAADPINKLNTKGMYEQQYVTVEDQITYTVRFENVSTAAAPLQELIIVDYLDTDLDWTTLQLDEFVLGNQIIQLPKNIFENDFRVFPEPQNNFGVTEGNLIINFSLSFNPKLGRLELRLRAIDTAIGKPPIDPLTGFLPPEDGSGRGTGYFNFRILPEPDLEQGVLLKNYAEVVFNNQVGNRTNTVVNTIYEPITYEYIYMPLIIK